MGKFPWERNFDLGPKFFMHDHDGEVRKSVYHLVLAVSKMVKKGRGRPHPFPIFKIGPNMAQSCLSDPHTSYLSGHNSKLMTVTLKKSP